MSLGTILAGALLAWGFFIAGRCWDTIRNPGRRRLHVAVRQSTNGEPLPHMMSAQIREGRRVIHFERVDMREEGWEEQLAEAVAGMKQKARAIEAAERNACER